MRPQYLIREWMNYNHQPRFEVVERTDSGDKVILRTRDISRRSLERAYNLLDKKKS